MRCNRCGIDRAVECFYEHPKSVYCKVCRKTNFANVKTGVKLDYVDVSGLWESSGNECALCDTALINIDVASMDHIVPICKGGENIISNIQFVHKTCNEMKYTMDNDVARTVIKSGGKLQYCKQCGNIKSVGEFHRNRSRRTGHNVRCKNCTNEYMSDANYTPVAE